MPTVRAKQIFDPVTQFYGEFGHFSVTQSIFSEGIRALIFWFFCIKAKEQIDKVRERQPGKMQKRKPAKRRTLHFLQASVATMFLEAEQKRAKILKTLQIRCFRGARKNLLRKFFQRRNFYQPMKHHPLRLFRRSPERSGDITAIIGKKRSRA